MIMMSWMNGGMIVLQEASYYSWAQLAGIFFSFLISCVGIFILTKKISHQRIEGRTSEDKEESISPRKFN